MTWRMTSKWSQTGLTGAFTVPVSARFLAQSASAAADYETGAWAGLPYVQQTGLPGLGTNIGHTNPYTGVTQLFVILAAYLITDTAITGTGAAGAGATAKIRLYTSAGVLVGTLFSL